MGETQVSLALLLRRQASSITLPRTEAFRPSLSLTAPPQRGRRFGQRIGALSQFLLMFLGRSCLPGAYILEAGQG